jgi:hypothetical protein
VNDTEVLYPCGEPIGAAVGERPVDPFLNHRKFGLCETISQCPENPRFEIPRSFSDIVIKCVRQCLPNCFCQIDIQLRWGRNVGVGRWPSAKIDWCDLNVSSHHPPPCTLQSQEEVSGMLYTSG